MKRAIATTCEFVLPEGFRFVSLNMNSVTLRGSKKPRSHILVMRVSLEKFVMIVLNFTLDPYSAGILNANDKCPKLNAAGDQDDADRDNVGDLCDNCPRDYNALNNGAQVWP